MTSGPTFVEWLRVQRDGDPDLEQAFARLYAYGPYFVRALGASAPDPIAFKAHLVLESVDPAEQESLLRELIIADATWCSDSFQGDEESGVPAGDPAIDSAAGEKGKSDPEKSTALAPRLKAVKCGFRDLDGTVCKSFAVDGAARCSDHGGAITDPNVRASLLLLAYAQLTKGTRTAVETLVNVMETSSNDLARVTAAKELLDRAGLSVDQHVTVTQSQSVTETRQDALDRIKAHLDTTKARLLPSPPESDDDIVDAEIVEHDDAPAA